MTAFRIQPDPTKAPAERRIRLVLLLREKSQDNYRWQVIQGPCLDDRRGFIQRLELMQVKAFVADRSGVARRRWMALLA
ncbi:hypothetical protein [Burkholderia sp. Se-20378]|uniref:hypothetical protein n=1 Tax=Burkholderia sp. Se-20378 TaxID=2703899 RepID=UPI0019818C8C|nr:hypothetical protein [Burkholderia sp. Se-20378]MBN3768033.1 hypothetical protein [Burkholderia sp. Se-20378]